MREITHIVIHCSATRASQDIGASEIDRWHRKKNWSQIGYHWVIRRDGRIEVGRPVEKAGAHVKGFNSNSIGLCLVGGVAEDGKTPEVNFTIEQVNEAVGLTQNLMGQYDVPLSKIMGHCEVIQQITRGSPKACPVLDMDRYRQKVAGLDDGEETSDPGDWGSGMQDDVHVVQRGDTLWGISREYDTTVDELRALNPWLLTNDLLLPGDEVRVR